MTPPEPGTLPPDAGSCRPLMEVPRGEYQPVPYEVAEVLRNAVTAVTTPAPGGAGVVTRDVPRFNFQTR